MKCKKALSAFLSGAVALTTVFSSSGITVLAEDGQEPTPVAAYNFEGTIGDATPLSSSHPNGNGLSDYEGEILYGEGRNGGQAVQLGDYGLKLNRENIGENYTVSMWVKSDQAIADNMSVLFLGHYQPEQWIGIAGTPDGGDVCKVWTNGDGFAWNTITNVDVPIGEWTQLTLTQEGQSLGVYVNGSLVKTGNAARALSGDNQDIYLGVTYWDPEFTGLVDDVKIYDQALTAEQVAAQYDGRSEEEILEEKGITVTETMNLMKGTEGQIQVTLPTGVTNAEVSYQSENDQIASVDQNGKVTGVEEGETTITTTVTVGSVTKTGTTSVSVTDMGSEVREEVVVEYNMAGASGNQLLDVSGHGNHGTIHNPETVVFTTDDGKNVMDIQDAQSYVDLPMGIAKTLENKEEFTIEATYSRSANAGGTSWLFCFGSIPKDTGTNYLFYCPYFSFGNGQVRAGIKNSTTEKLFETGIQNQNDTYYTVNMVVNNGTITLYLDGVKIGGQLDSGFSIEKDVINGGTSDGILGYLGKSCWAQDTNFVGKIASFKIYDKAMTDEEVQNANPEFKEKLQQKLNEGIQTEDLLGSRNESADQVYYDLTLPEVLDEMEVVWSSSDPDVITEDGSVKNQSEDREVTLTATVTSGVLSVSKEFTFTVKAMDRSELDALIAQAKEALDDLDKTEEEKQAIQDAIDAAEQIDNQAEVAGAVFALKVALGIVNYEDAAVEKSQGGNPIAGFSDSGEVTYAGDPSVLVDGDTVYLYVGHDVSTADNYVMPNYYCYSTKDMKEWKFEGEIMNMQDVVWGDNNSAWAGQVMKHNGKYYLYFCSWNNQDNGRQSIGVAVSDSPTGPFVDKGSALIKGSETYPESSTWNDIDPTAWIETDENGEEHIYLAWGNSKWYMCELNDDMVSVKDQNGDGAITMNQDIWEQSITGMDGSFTEAPYLYRQQDEDGNYYGKYYLFYAMNWREEMAYCTKEDINDFDEPWVYGGRLMPPSATANTNHPAVFDFQGKTYFIYHNGSLPWGSGYRRVACIQEFSINEDGTIDPIQETSIGLTGTASQILGTNEVAIAHENWENTLNDADYPITKSVGMGISQQLDDTLWEILPGKADQSEDSYISIQSYNKPGLYLKADGETLVLTQDADTANGQGITKDSASMTFKTLKGFAGYGVTLESVAYPGYFVTVEDGKLTLSQNPDLEDATFMLSGMTEEDYLEKGDISVKETLELTTGEQGNVNLKLHQEVSNAQISYSSDNQEVATVDQSGNVTVHSAGEAQITTTVTLGDVTKTAKTKVVASVLVVDEDVAVEYAMTGAAGERLVDVSGHGNHGTIHNPDTVEFIEEDGRTVMNITSQESYVDLPIGIMDDLTNQEQFTIEATYSRSASAGGTSWLFCFGSIPKTTGTNYLFYCPYFSFGNGEVRAGIKDSTKEQLFSTGIRNQNDTYYTVNMVVNNGVITLYIDGMRIGSQLDSGYSIVEDIVNGGTANGILGYLGKSCWSQDTNFVGKIASFKIYDKAMTDEEVQMANPQFQEKLQQKLEEGLQAEDLLGSKNTSADRIVYDLTLPTVFDEMEMNWISSDPDVITESGKVINGTEPKTVTLTAEVISGVLRATKSFTFTVMPTDRTKLEQKIKEAEQAVANAAYMSEESVAALRKAIGEAKAAVSQTEAESAIRTLQRAIDGLTYSDAYLDPISLLEGSEPAAALELKEKDSLQIFSVPESIKNMVTVSYETNMPTVASYADGTVTALKAGTATVTTIVTAKYDGYSVRYRTVVTVKADQSSGQIQNPDQSGGQEKPVADLSKVTIKAGKTKLAKGKSTKVTVTLPSDVQAASPKISYKAKGAVSVTSVGKIKAKKAGKGTVTVTVTADGRSISKKLTISVGDIQGKSSVKAGKAITLKVKGISGKVRWSVNKKKLAKIGKKGKLTAKKKGKVVVTAKVSGVTIRKAIRIK